MATFNDWIEKLQLEAHPEGGYFRESYRSPELIQADGLPDRYASARHVSTAIYFLLTSDNHSHFHKVASDEGWHFYDGSPVRLHIISPEGEYTSVLVGCDFEKNILPQYVVPAEHWFAAEVTVPDSFSLVGCTVAPGFDFADFELAEQQSLISTFPHLEAIIQRFTADK
ncbi:MAG: cupin domain-containing protein [Bacteroidia bacterium]